MFAFRGEGPTHEDFIKPGVIYGFRTLGMYPRQTGNVPEKYIYCFGRSRHEAFREVPEDGEGAATEQKALLRKRRFTGMNAPNYMTLWVRVADIEKCWDAFRQCLRRGACDPVTIDGVAPSLTQDYEVGDNFYTVWNMGTETFGRWCRATMQKIVEPPQLVPVQRAGDEMLIGPVSSEVAAAALCGMLEIQEL